MYLNAERIAVANQAIRDTFEQTSIAWQAIPHWDTGDPAQTKVRADSAYAPLTKMGPLGEDPVTVETMARYFYVSVAQAISPTPDALLDAVIARAVQLAAQVDEYVIDQLLTKSSESPEDIQTGQTAAELMKAFIKARAGVEKAGYRAPSCLLTDTAGLEVINKFEDGYPILGPLLEAASVNSRYRVDTLEVSKKAEESKTPDKPKTTSDKPEQGRMILLGRRQRIAHGGAAATAAGEEPVDLALSVPPSLEVIGEVSDGNIELAVRIRLAARITDKSGIVGVVIH